MKLTQAEAEQRIADTQQHVRDGLITREEGDSKIAQIKQALHLTVMADYAAHVDAHRKY